MDYLYNCGRIIGWGITTAFNWARENPVKCVGLAVLVMFVCSGAAADFGSALNAAGYTEYILA